VISGGGSVIRGGGSVISVGEISVLLEVPEIGVVSVRASGMLVSAIGVLYWQWPKLVPSKDCFVLLTSGRSRLVFYYHLPWGDHYQSSPSKDPLKTI
jgi:hypothetical protein